MVFELIGLSIFVFYRTIIHNLTWRKSSGLLLNEKREKIQKFLNQVGYSRRAELELPNEVYDEGLEYIGVIYRYQISRVLNEGSILSQIKPRLRKELVSHTLSTTYLNFRDFFYDPDSNFSAHDNFIYKFLTTMDSIMFCPDTSIISRGDPVDNIYLIAKGSVVVYDHNIGEHIATIPYHGYFGDYQILLNTNSNLSFKAPVNKPVICYKLDKQTFLTLLNDYKGHYDHYLSKAVENRREYKVMVKQRYLEIRQAYDNYVQSLQIRQKYVTNQGELENIELQKRILSHVRDFVVSLFI